MRCEEMLRAECHLLAGLVPHLLKRSVGGQALSIKDAQNRRARSVSRSNFSKEEIIMNFRILTQLISTLLVLCVPRNHHGI